MVIKAWPLLLSLAKLIKPRGNQVEQTPAVKSGTAKTCLNYKAIIQWTGGKQGRLRDMTLKVVLRFAADMDGAKTTTVFFFDTLYWRHDDAMPITPFDHFNGLNNTCTIYALCYWILINLHIDAFKNDGPNQNISFYDLLQYSCVFTMC